ncbi:YegJ family protein [Shewanella baltica]|uniref:YegJ family protein n=1 Tax=Shewanella baltica TaxID=62322 RepID=UPI00325CE1B5
MKKLAFALALIAGYTIADENKVDDRVVYVSEEDQEMNKAIVQAQQTLDQFLITFRNPPEGAVNFKLKVMLSDKNGVEHFWFTPFKEIDGGFAGVLANEPSVITSVQTGNVYAFKRDQITDWGYEQAGVQHGSFTVCALFKFMDQELVKRYKQDHGFVCSS